MQFSKYWVYATGKPASLFTKKTKRTGFSPTWAANRIL